MNRIRAIWNFFQEKIVEHLSRYLLLGVVLLSFVEVIRRYIFGASFIWAEDVEVYFNLVAVFFYFGLAQRQKAHIELDLFLQIIKKRRRRWGEILEIGSDLISLSFCVLFIWFGMKFVKAGMDFGRRSENADLLLWPFYALLLVGFVFLGVEFARSLFLQFKKLKEGGN